MSDQSLDPVFVPTLSRPQDRPPGFGRILLAALAWGAAGLLTLAWPDGEAVARTAELAALQFLLAAVLAVVAPFHGWLGKAGRWFRSNAPRLVAFAAVVALWELASAKTGYWRSHYVPAPQTVLDVYVTDYARILDSLKSSLILLATGAGIGAGAGFLTGLATGWTRRVGYWTRPVLRFIGPVPATALIPIALFLFPTSFSASVFLVALATWFSVAILTWSGVESVDDSYYDVARTLGASTPFLLFRVAIPASLPHVFVGLFMGLGSAIATLVVAEMVGVQSGLGYYLQWAQGWGAYGHLFAGLILMAVIFSTLTTLLFAIRDRVVTSGEETVKW